ncbi:ribonuclease E/G, partial [Oceanospirillum sp. HFRX-1_2]
VELLIVPNPHMETPHYEVSRLRDDQLEAAGEEASFEISTEATDKEEEATVNKPVERAQAAVRSVVPATPAPTAPQAEKPAVTEGFFSKLIKGLGNLFAGDSSDSTAKEKKATQDDSEKDSRNNRDKSNRNRRRNERKPRRDNRRDNRNRDER